MKYLPYLFIISLSLASAASTAEDSSSADLLNQFLGNMSSIKAEFKQRIEGEQGDLLQESSGQVVLNRPQQFLWRTQVPYEHLLVTNGDILWLHDLDLEQVTKQTLSNDIQQTPALLLSGDIVEIKNQFVISHKESSDTLIFELTPKQESGIFTRLSLQFTNGVISAMSFQDGFAQQTTIEFENVIVNPVIQLSTFTFVPPEGIDIINNDPTLQPLPDK